MVCCYFLSISFQHWIWIRRKNIWQRQSFVSLSYVQYNVDYYNTLHRMQGCEDRWWQFFCFLYLFRSLSSWIWIAVVQKKNHWNNFNLISIFYCGFSQVISLLWFTVLVYVVISIDPHHLYVFDSFEFAGIGNRMNVTGALAIATVN